MRLWRRGERATGPPAPRSWAHRAGWAVVCAAPVAIVAVVALLVTSTLGQFQASITNTENRVVSRQLGPFEETQNSESCTAQANGQFTVCGSINKYAGGTTVPSIPPVTLHNGSNVPVNVSLLPFVCSDNNGAGADFMGAEVCGDVSVSVECIPSAGPGGSPGTLTTRTLNDFFTGRPFPDGYPMGSIPAGGTTTCTFTLTTTGTITVANAISQPLAWRFTPIP